MAFAGNPCCEPPQVDNSVLIPWHTLTPGALLGEGASGRIIAAQWQQTSGLRPVAVKCFKGQMTSDGLPQNERIAALAAGRHPGLIELLGEIPDHPEGVASLVMALIDPAFVTLAGPPSLDSCTRDVYDPALTLTGAAVVGLALKIAAVAAHLHRRGILHGDLYAHNILHNGQGDALLGDFGAASFYPPDSAQGRALERLEVRAYGCLLDELLARCHEPAAWHQPLLALSQACLQPDPAGRPDFAQILARLQAFDTAVC